LTANALLTFTSLILGLFVGSLLTEAVILVPYWRSLKSETFLVLHGTLGPRLYKYFAPLTILATLLPTITAIFCIWTGANAWIYSVAADLLVLAIFGIYFYYFKKANASFASGSVGVAGLPAELRRWCIWHLALAQNDNGNGRFLACAVRAC